MQWTGKVIGGLLGIALGPFGAALGVAVGHQFDVKLQRSRTRPIGKQFFRSTFRLMGHVAKADGRVTEREIQAARGVMHTLRLNPQQVLLAIEEFSYGKHPDFDAGREMDALRAASLSNPDLLRTFLEIQLRFAVAGGGMTDAARRRLTSAAGQLGVMPQLLARMEEVLRAGIGAQPAAAQSPVDRTDAAYRTLELEPAAGNEDLTKAYRRLMSRHHPDKLKANGLPESMLEHAKERTQAIREAYDLLREQRGIS